MADEEVTNCGRCVPHIIKLLFFKILLLAMNVPKMATDDLQLFNSIISDLFPILCWYK
jgi:hypothetical protein